MLQPSGVEVIFAWFLRVIAGYCLLFGILYWIQLIGFYPGPLWRFDLMPVHWQVAAVVLAVFFPFAAGRELIIVFASRLSPGDCFVFSP